VRVELANPDGVLKPGMFATIVPSEAVAQDAETQLTLAVPGSALQRDGRRFFVFVQTDERTFEQRAVTVSVRSVAFVAVSTGLVEGETVVVEGAFILKSEAAKHRMGGGHSH
jgi:hypothetical protein